MLWVSTAIVAPDKSLIKARMYWGGGALDPPKIFSIPDRDTLIEQSL